MSTTHQRTIAVIGTGGTIASRESEDGVVAALSTEELLATIPADQLPQDFQLTASDVNTRTSFAFSLQDMLAIATAAIEAARDAEGVVVLHGTDSMEETSFLTDLLYDGATPIVFTGAQRNADAPDGDGPANMALAITTAADTRARDSGVLVAFDGHLWFARGVRKVHTSDLSAFVTPGRPAVDLEAPASEARSTLPLAVEAGKEISSLPRVDVVAGVPGGDGTAISASREAGAKAIVYQAMGIGNAGPGDGEEIKASIEAGVPVLISSRVIEGSVAPVYGNGGGETLHRYGAIFAGALSPWQARVLAAAALAAEPKDFEGLVRDWVETRGAGYAQRT